MLIDELRVFITTTSRQSFSRKVLANMFSAKESEVESELFRLNVEGLVTRPQGDMYSPIRKI